MQLANLRRLHRPTLLRSFTPTQVGADGFLRAVDVSSVSRNSAQLQAVSPAPGDRCELEPRAKLLKFVQPPRVGVEANCVRCCGDVCRAGT